jgi:hypothetical protein
MLTFNWRDATGFAHESTWSVKSVGAQTHHSILRAIDPDNTQLSILADGDELALIRKVFTNIPMTTRPAVMWTGEIVRFILMNLSEES